MDKKDLQIIQLLKEDSRHSIKEISSKTGIKPSTVHQRILRLKKGGVIEHFTIKLNNEKTGESFIVFILVKTKPSAVLEARILNNIHIKEIFGITGEYDLLLKLKFKDVAEFNDFLIKFRKEQQIENTLTMVATAVVKEEV